MSKESIVTKFDNWERMESLENSPEFDQSASELLQAIESAAIPVSYLEELLTSRHWRIRASALWVASEIGRGAAPLLPACLDALTDPSPEVRAAATEVVLAIGQPAISDAFPQLVKMLFDDHESARRSTMAVLIAADGNMFRSRLVDLIEQGVSDVPQLLSIQNCLEIVTASNPKIEELSDCLSSSEKATRLSAIVVAYHLGVIALPILVVALRHDDEEVRDSATRFSYRLGNALMPSLIERIQLDPIESVRVSALSSLARIRKLDLGPFRSLIVSKLSDSSDSIRLAALQCMKHLKPLRVEDVASIVERIHDNDEFVRSAAGMALNEAARDRSINMDAFIDELFSLAADDSLDGDVCQVRADVLYALGDCSAARLTEAIRERQHEIGSLLDESDDHIVFRTLYLLSRCNEISKSLVSKVQRINARSPSPDIERICKQILSPQADK